MPTGRHYRHCTELYQQSPWSAGQQRHVGQPVQGLVQFCRNRFRRRANESGHLDDEIATGTRAVEKTDEIPGISIIDFHHRMPQRGEIVLAVCGLQASKWACNRALTRGQGEWKRLGLQGKCADSSALTGTNRPRACNLCTRVQAAERSMVPPSRHRSELRKGSKVAKSYSCSNRTKSSPTRSRSRLLSSLGMSASQPHTG